VRNKNGIYPNPFTEIGYDIIFDVVTMYEILTKTMILNIFNEYVTKFSNDEMIPILNNYCFYNARVLGISNNYKLLGKKFQSTLENLNIYINKTKNLREELIEIIK
jgi:hypothetical protein